MVANRTGRLETVSAAPIRIVKGLDVPITGAPEQVVGEAAAMRSVALLGRDFVGLRPQMLVEEGARVSLGQPLFADRRQPEILFTAPGSGVVRAVNRGPRRALLSVVIDLDGDDTETFEAWPADRLAGLARDRIAGALLKAGLWPALRARPFGHIADPVTAPSSIFVTAMDSNPLAARADVVIDAQRDDFAAGLAAIARLTDGPVYVCHAPGAPPPAGAGDNVHAVAFAGSHPAGLVGTHINVLDPVGPDKTVWHIGCQDVIAVGRTLTTGRPWIERIVALGGPVVARPRLLRTRLGAAIDDLTDGELTDGACRVISGSVLSGRQASGAEAYLGRYHSQVSALAEGAPSEGTRGAFSIYSPGAAAKPVRRRFALTTATHGGPGPMVPFGGFERVMPLDILPTPLLRALLVGDIDAALALGCLELEEEDLALCAFVCPGKIDYGAALRAALECIEKEGG